MRVAVKALTFVWDGVSREELGPNLNWCQKAMRNDKTLFFFVFALISNCEFKESRNHRLNVFCYWNVGGMKPRTITMPIVDNWKVMFGRFATLGDEEKWIGWDCGQESHKACNYSMEHFYDSCYLHVRLLSWHIPHGFIFHRSCWAQRQAHQKGHFAGRLSSGESHFVRILTFTTIAFGL